MLAGLNKHKIRIISLGLVAVLLLLLLLFNNQITNLFVKLQAPPQKTVIKLQPPAATPTPAPQPVVTSTTKPVTPPRPKITTMNHEKKLLKMQGYTIQLMGVYKFSQIKAFMLKHHLQNKAYIFHSINKNRDWYTLIYGNYATRDEAQAAKQQLPDNLQALKPWIRSMDSVHTAILEGKS